MAWFSYNCKTHGPFKKSLEERMKTNPCPKCSIECKPLIRSGTSQVVERLDNGAMGRAIERLHNIEEIMEDRDEKFKDQTEIGVVEDEETEN